ncbi:MAG: hypothetical protein KatS3mg070_0221 [Meiothermus sp.]|uniref:class IIb bacteriocin, lactobin A/cerein 7B family n=1 Tax=Meiothermus sp. TaxID=1955249 RepID=UPI0021DE748E|nr:class IIb bacteriocin, lactobin A/cerein 7B family [Meiothermus sp.]MCX8089291.1 class IIb bacteriocin, lactobin A/cerein 7B family [Meiothermus ruber]GIW26858.1 MAG: hypothetical protein KatS3mg070_0221 [Meiothermus sp.]
MIRELSVEELETIEGGVIPAAAWVIASVGVAAAGIGAGVSMVINALRDNNPESSSSINTPNFCAPSGK